MRPEQNRGCLAHGGSAGPLTRCILLPFDLSQVITSMKYPFCIRVLIRLDVYVLCVCVMRTLCTICVMYDIYI